MSKNFFLISFLPAIAYWYLESHYEPKIAATGGVLLALFEVGIEKIFIKHIHSISMANFCLIFFLGGLSFIDNEGIWFKLQPCITGVGIGCFLSYKVFKGKGLLYEMMGTLTEKNKLPPGEVMIKFEMHTAVFFFLYGIFMGGVALKGTTGQWTFFKTAGFYLVSIVFFLFEVIWLRFAIKRYYIKKHAQAVEKF